ncbi:hypothetical protein SUGI_0138490 [Cryptomeria japonica]|nr:hypothetical protein SUGI_0138490 [Cryptomeria japonica]
MGAFKREAQNLGQEAQDALEDIKQKMRKGKEKREVVAIACSDKSMEEGKFAAVEKCPLEDMEAANEHKVEIECLVMHKGPMFDEEPHEK